MIATARQVTTMTDDDNGDDDGYGDGNGAMGSGDEGDGLRWATTAMATA